MGSEDLSAPAVFLPRAVARLRAPVLGIVLTLRLVLTLQMVLTLRLVLTLGTVVEGS